MERRECFEAIAEEQKYLDNFFQQIQKEKQVNKLQNINQKTVSSQEKALIIKSRQQSFRQTLEHILHALPEDLAVM